MCDEKHKLHYLLPAEKPGKHYTRSGQIYRTPVCGTNRFKDSFVNYCLFNFQTGNDTTSLTEWTAMWYSTCMWYYATVITMFLYIFIFYTSCQYAVIVFYPIPCNCKSTIYYYYHLNAIWALRRCNPPHTHITWFGLWFGSHEKRHVTCGRIVIPIAVCKRSCHS